MVAVLAAVLHHTAPGVALADSLPEIGKGLGWHIRVPDQVVGLPYQFINTVAGDFREFFIGSGNLSLQICGGNQVIVRGVFALVTGNRFVPAHGALLRGVCFVLHLLSTCIRWRGIRILQMLKLCSHFLSLSSKIRRFCKIWIGLRRFLPMLGQKSLPVAGRTRKVFGVCRR